MIRDTILGEGRELEVELVVWEVVWWGRGEGRGEGAAWLGRLGREGKEGMGYSRDILKIFIL